MKYPLVLAAAGLLAVSGGAIAQDASSSSQTKLSQNECMNLWQQAGGSESARLSKSQVQPYLSDFNAANPDSDSTIEQDEWLAACNNGLVQRSSAAGASPGEAGSANTPEKVHPPTNRVGKEVPTMKSPADKPATQ